MKKKLLVIEIIDLSNIENQIIDYLPFYLLRILLIFIYKNFINNLYL